MNQKAFIIEKKKILTKLWKREDIGRPAFVIPDYLPEEKEVPVSSSPEKNTPQTILNSQLQQLEKRVLGKDDYIPRLSTNIGTYVWALALGCELIKLDDGRIFVKEPIIHKPEDVYKIKRPKITDGKLGFVLELTKYFEEQAGDVYPIEITDVQTPLTIGPLVWETNNFFLSLYGHKKEVHYLFEMMTELVIEFVKAQKEIISDFVPICWPPIWMPPEFGIFCSDDTSSMVSPELYEEFGLPYVNRISEAFGGIFFHSCQIKEPHFPNLLKIKGLRGINFDLSGSADFGKIVEFFGKKTVIVPHSYLCKGVPFKDEVGYVEYILEKVPEYVPLFFYVCNVMQDPVTSRDRPINPERLYQFLKNRGIKLT